jgi:GMP synthase (glutamine-hydrolysing)
MKVLIIQNNILASSGYIGECIQNGGGSLHIFQPFNGDQIPSTDTGYDGLIILGGIMNAEEDHLYPHLKEIVHLIEQFHHTNKPLLGVCLGAQLISRAFGKRVYPHHTVELGFTELFLTEDGKQDQLLRGTTTNLSLMQWHNDTYDLPSNATLLMYGETCNNQAFRIGDKTYGFQCHFEVTDTIIKQWFKTYKELINDIDTDILDNIDLQIIHHIESSNEFCKHIIHR